MASSTPSTSHEEKYRQFVNEIAFKFPRFKPLNAFLRSIKQPSPGNVTHITAITFSPSHKPSKPRNIDASDLETELAKGIDHQLFVVENISSTVLAQLGGYCDVDPEFFFDHIDASIPDEQGVPVTSQKVQNIEPIPWYRLRNIDDHLPTLRSIQPNLDHVHLRFIGSREYHSDQSHKLQQKLPDRILQHAGRSNVERIAGGYNPIPRKSEMFDPVALTRHGATAWFNKRGTNGEWTKCEHSIVQYIANGTNANLGLGIILLDPPFEESAKGFGHRMSSKYKSFVCRPLPPGIQNKDLDPRDTYQASFVHCLTFSENVQSIGVPHPLAILQDLYRIIASEWLTVNTYVERDLNTIAWQLETEKRLAPEKLEMFLEELFILRRRIGRYQSLVDEQFEIYRGQMPQSWDCSSSKISDVFAAIQDDFEQVQKSIQRNVDRVSESVDLITSIISVRAGEMGLVQNETLRFLTLVATVALPFNLVAAILAMQTEYGPGQRKFRIFWATSVATFVGIWVCFWLYKISIRIGKESQLKSVKRQK